MEFDQVGVGLTCEKCGTEYEQRIDLTPAEVVELAENRLTKKVPSRCPNCGQESETILRAGQIGQG
jgi:DNA-directed RNA polymerase subunit RPC12/RpoP